MHPKNFAIAESAPSRQTPGQASLAHSWIIFTQVLLISLIALFAPLPVFAIDILIAANLAMTAILLFLILFANEPARITFIPSWAGLLALLRLAAGIAASRSLFLNGDAGKIVTIASAKIYYGFLSTVAGLIIIAVLCIVICAAAVFIFRKAVGYLDKIIPARCSSLETEYENGIITHVQMLRAITRIKKQTMFFWRIEHASGLLVCEAVMMAVIFSALLVVSTIKPRAAAPDAALAIAGVCYIPGFLLALALGVLLNKRFLINLKVRTTMTQTFQPDNLIAKTSGLAPAAVQAARDRAQEEPAAEQTGLPNALIDTAADEQFNSIENSTPAAQETVHDAPEIKRDDYYYDSILATIGHKKRAAILLAAQKPAELPITVAVELVIHVIESRKRCLLIDMDPARNAVSAAFDIDINSMQGKAIPTGIDKLWICPADRPDDLAQTPLSRKIANALRYFHYIVIYAPNAADREIQKGFVKTADVAVMFGNTKSPEMQEFSKMLSDSGCRVIAEHEFAATQPLETA